MMEVMSTDNPTPDGEQRPHNSGHGSSGGDRRPRRDDKRRNDSRRPQATEVKTATEVAKEGGAE